MRRRSTAKVEKGDDVMARIKWIVDITSSRADSYGNQYHMARFTRTCSGRSIVLYSNGPSNSKAVGRELAGGYQHLHVTESELGIRAFENRYEPIAYFDDCDPVEAAKIVKRLLDRRKTK